MKNMNYLFWSHISQFLNEDKTLEHD